MSNGPSGRFTVLCSAGDGVQMLRTPHATWGKPALAVTIDSELDDANPKPISLARD
jgi:hypothetical protein